MFFNADKNTKQNMFQQYKKDALEYEQRKKQEKQKRIQEERDYLTLNQKRETLIEDKMRLDKLKRQSETMSDYKKMLEQNNGHWKTPKNNLTINTDNTNINQIQNNYNKIDDYHTIECPGQRERAYVRKEDNMGKYLTDRHNAIEVEHYFIKQKEKRQKYYKELLDSQVCYVYICFIKYS